MAEIKLRRILWDRRLRTREAAKLLKIDEGTLSKILRQKYVPGPKTLRRIALALGLPLEEADTLLELEFADEATVAKDVA